MKLLNRVDWCLSRVNRKSLILSIYFSRAAVAFDTFRSRNKERSGCGQAEYSLPEPQRRICLELLHT